MFFFSAHAILDGDGIRASDWRKTEFFRDADWKWPRISTF
jgi:hypothetical protein